MKYTRERDYSNHSVSTLYNKALSPDTCSSRLLLSGEQRILVLFREMPEFVQ